LTHQRIVIVGTGFSGLRMAIKLRQEGEGEFDEAAYALGAAATEGESLALAA
jgi:cation diffusion facilitator CzcD-associated flavoprotein CzcO